MCLLALVGCAKLEPQSATQLQFKGVELNSWKPAGRNWHFSLLPGRNWRPPISEITKPEHAIVGVSNLKKKLSELPKGENVFWLNLAKEPVPKSIKKELMKHSEVIGIKLHLPTNNTLEFTARSAPKLKVDVKQKNENMIFCKRPATNEVPEPQNTK